MSEMLESSSRLSGIESVNWIFGLITVLIGNNRSILGDRTRVRKRRFSKRCKVAPLRSNISSASVTPEFCFVVSTRSEYQDKHREVTRSSCRVIDPRDRDQCFSADLYPRVSSDKKNGAIGEKGTMV